MSNVIENLRKIAENIYLMLGYPYKEDMENNHISFYYDLDENPFIHLLLDEEGTMSISFEAGIDASISASFINLMHEELKYLFERISISEDFYLALDGNIYSGAKAYLQKDIDSGYFEPVLTEAQDSGFISIQPEEEATIFINSPIEAAYNYTREEWKEIREILKRKRWHED